jgi:tellurite resistance protein
VFGSSLGLLGIYLLAETNRFLGSIHPVFLGCLAAGFAALATGIGLHLCRWLFRPIAFRRDIMSPALSPFLAQIGIALLLLAEALPVLSQSAADVAFLAGTGVTVAAGLWWLYRISQTPFSFSNITHGWLVPGIAMLYVGLLAPTLGYEVLGVPAIAVGLAFGLMSVVAVAGRLIKGPPLPRPAMPALTIPVALPGLLTIWVAAFKPGWSALGSVLYWMTLLGFGLGLVGFVIACLRLPFAVSWWGFGMPLTAASIGLVQADAALHLPLSSVAADGTAFLCVAITAIPTALTCRSGWLQVRGSVSANGVLAAARR